MYLDRFGPGLRLVLRLALILIGAWLVHAVVVLVTTLRDALVLGDDLPATGHADAALAHDGIDRVHDALDLFEQRYREAVERPALRWGEPTRFGDGSPSVEFVDPQVDDQWRRAHRDHGDQAL